MSYQVNLYTFSYKYFYEASHFIGCYRVRKMYEKNFKKPFVSDRAR